LHPRIEDGMFPSAEPHTNLPIHAGQKGTIHHFDSARSGSRESSHKCPLVLVDVPVALNIISAQLQPRDATGSEGTVFALAGSYNGGVRRVSRAVGDGSGCGAAGISDTGFHGGVSRVDDGTDGVASVA
jgi:hypothetical protein